MSTATVGAGAHSGVRRIASAIGGGLTAAFCIAFYHVRDSASLTAVLRHAIRDWYEIPAFIVVASLVFYAFGRETDRATRHDEARLGE